jgi:hypothetical protein
MHRRIWHKVETFGGADSGTYSGSFAMAEV